MNTNHLGPVAYRALIAGAALALVAFPARATYWSLFNLEGESAQGSRYVTYASFTDMLGDTNRLGVFDPDGFGASRNVVGSGSDDFPVVPGVPEPSTLVLAPLGLAGLVRRVTRHRPPRPGP